MVTNTTNPYTVNGQTYNIPAGNTAQWDPQRNLMQVTNTSGESRTYNPSQITSWLAPTATPKPTTPAAPVVQTPAPKPVTPATVAPTAAPVLPTEIYKDNIPRAPKTSDYMVNGQVDAAKYNQAANEYYKLYPNAWAEQYQAATGKVFLDPTTGKPVPTQASVSVPQFIANQSTNPKLPTGGELTPVLSAVDIATLQKTGQMLNGPGGLTPATPLSAGQPINAAQTSTAPAYMLNPATGQYEAVQIGANTPQAQAAQMAEVDPLATVRGQLSKLYAESDNGTIPTWAKGAATAAQEMLAARGMGASSIGAGAVLTAIQNSALNIASQDAQTYFQKDLQNLSNRQQTSLANVQLRQQSMLSDQAAENAAKQFGATSATQVQQFQAQLISQINEQNANRVDAMSKYNTEKDLAVQQFNSTNKLEREKFNTEMQFAIEQSNVLWRRTLNAENTAAVNAANMTNVMNKYNISQTALNALWQQYRDEASWAFSAAENERTRAYNVSMVANNQSYINSQKPSLAQQAGQFAIGLLLGS